MSGNRSDDSGGPSESRWTAVAQRRYDPTGAEELTTEVVYAIAEAVGVEPSDLTGAPLYETVDVPSIETMFFGPGRDWESERADGCVTFHYDEYQVSVDSDGRITVSEEV